MKKFSKLIALLLLLAVVVSVFAVLPAFAAEATADTGIRTIFDLEQGIGGSLLNDGDSNNSVASAVTRRHTDANGVTYYTVSFSEGKSVAGNAQVQPFFQASPERVYFQDGAGETADSTVNDTVDYIVIDLDVGTDTNPLGMIQFQNRFYHWGYNTSNKWAEVSSQNDHPRMFGDVGEDVYFDGTKTDTKRYPAMQSSTEWAHITMIVDVTDGDGFRNAYLYYNGQYVATYVNMAADATFLWQIRLMIGDKSAPDYDDETFSFANYTIKAFEKGYDGDLATYYSRIGNANYPLSYFSDLTYCLEDLPENTVATITRANAEGVEQTTAVTSFDDLDANLETGDKVTLYRDLVRKIVVPEGVTFDLNNYHMAEPLVLTDYDELDWIIRDKDGNIYNREVKTSETDADGNPIIEYHPAKGAQVYGDDGVTIATDTLQAFWDNYYYNGGSSKRYDKLPEAELKVTFLNDTTLKNTSNHSLAVAKGGKLIYDLNGKTIEMKSLGAHYFRAIDASAVIIVSDGTITHSGSNNLFYSADADSKMYTKDVTINSTGTLIDQRRGTVAFFDSNVNISNSFSVKSSQGYTSYFILDGSTLTATGDEAISVTSTSSGKAGDGAGRYGGMQNNVIVTNSTVNAKSKAIAVLVHANEHDSASGVSKSNTNYSKIDIVNSTVKGARAVDYTLNNLYSEYQKVDGTVEKRNVFADGLSSVNTLRLDGATLDATYPIVKSDSTAYSNAKKATYKDAASNTVTPDFDNYTFTLDIVASDSDIKANAHLIHDSSVKVGITLNASELKLSSNVIVKAGQVAPTLNLAEGQKLVPASDSVYPFAVTANYTTYTYKLGAAEPVEFCWYGTDTPDMSRVVTLESVKDLYHYEWKIEDKAYIATLVNDFSLAAKDNLSLVDYIYYNLYVDKEQYDAFAEYVSFSGAKLDADETIEIEGTTYYKLQAKNVNLADIVTPSITATVTYTTVYGETYTADKALSIYDYTARILETSQDEASIALIEAVLNYIASAQEYKGQDSSLVRALIADKEFAAPAEETVAGEAPVEVAVQYGDYISWLVKATEDTTVTVAYTVNDEDATLTKTLKAGEEFEIRVKARDFANGITVTAGDKTATVTVASYYAKLGLAEDKAMVAAIYNYAIAAQNYKPAN